MKPRLDWFYFGFILFVGTFALSAQLKRFRTTRFLPITACSHIQYTCSSCTKSWSIDENLCAQVRCLASDFSVALAIVIMSAFDALVGVDTPKLNVPHEFRPTSPLRGWLVPPFTGNPWWTVPLAFPPALLCCVRSFGTQPQTSYTATARNISFPVCSSRLQILLFMDQQITAVIVNRREHKLQVLPAA